MLFDFFSKFKKITDNKISEKGPIKETPNKEIPKTAKNSNQSEVTCPIDEKIKKAQTDEDFLKIAAETNPYNQSNLNYQYTKNSKNKNYKSQKSKTNKPYPVNSNKDACYVTYVADGDTFCGIWQQQKIWIRLAEKIDAPEMGEKTQGDQPLAWQVKMYLERLIHKKQVYLTVHEKDKYGRTIASVFLDIGKTINVSEMLAKAGFVFPLEGASPQIQKAIDEAVLNRRGIWADGTSIEPKKWRKIFNK